jgi:DNA repair exonuclease SbcCD ATPase subunit
VLLALRLRKEALVLTQVEIENFQSLRKLSIRLGRFTVVTGATGSGKSAVIRAARLLAFNARGTSYITRGAKSCKVASGDQEQGWAVGIERGASRGRDCYRLAYQPQSGDEPHAETWTKLGGDVPEQIQSALQLSELNFAAQFDRPFLLDASGGEIARVLGRLTNVTLLFDAAREASRRRLEIMGDLKRAEANLAGLTQAAQRFRGMRERHAAVSDAETALECARDAEGRLARLRALTARLEVAQAALELAAPPGVPSGEQLDGLLARRQRIVQLLVQLRESGNTMTAAQGAAAVAADQEVAAHERLHEVLAAAGRCPTCGSEIRDSAA